MHNFHLPVPNNEKEVLVLKDFSVLEKFLGKNYNPKNITNWNDYLITKKQPESYFSEKSNMLVQEYIDTVLSKYPDFSLKTLNSLPCEEKKFLTDMFLRMRLDKLQAQFGDYILFYLFFEAYPHGRYESYLKEYAVEHFDFMKKYGFETIDMIRHLAHRLGWKNIDFGGRMEILRLFLLCNEGDHRDLFAGVIHSSECKEQYKNDLSIGPIWPKSIWGCGYTKEPGTHGWIHDIHKNEYTATDCFLDAPLALCLYYKGEMIAAISGMEWEPGEFVIHQMQAISKNVLSPHGVTKPSVINPITRDIPRQEILFSAMSSLLNSLGIKKVYIQPGEKNPWRKEMATRPEWDPSRRMFFEVPTDIPHLSEQIAHQIYDVFAEKKGFTKDETGFWTDKKQQFEKKKTKTKRLSSTA